MFRASDQRPYNWGCAHSVSPLLPQGKRTLKRAVLSAEVTALMPEIRVESRLPEGWVPEGTTVAVFAVHDEGQWDALLPEFTIAGRGDTFDEAVTESLELLEDYLLLCAQEGRSFQDSYRGIGVRHALANLLTITKLYLRERLRGRDDRYRRDRLPLPA